MENEKIKEPVIILIAVIILSLTVLFQRTDNFLVDFSIAFFSFLIIISTSIFVKKIVANHYEADIKTKFWEFYRYGFKRGSHLKKPTPMVLLPVILTLFSRGTFWWLGLLEFDIKPKPERVAKRHGLYRFSEMTERHIGTISLWGVISCLILSVIGYILGGYWTGFEQFARLSTFYALWSIVPFSSLDGTKIFFGNKGTWITLTIITLLFFAAAMII